MSYVIDSGSLIKLINHYPPDIFPGIANNLAQITAQGRLISSSECLRELAKQDSPANDWATQNKDLFLRPTADEQRVVQMIMANYPFLLKQRSILEGSPEADPFLIAQASTRRICLITEERHKPNAQKIPNICQDLATDCCDIYEFFRREGWSY